MIELVNVIVSQNMKKLKNHPCVIRNVKPNSLEMKTESVKLVIHLVRTVLAHLLKNVPNAHLVTT